MASLYNKFLDLSVLKRRTISTKKIRTIGTSLRPVVATTTSSISTTGRLPRKRPHAAGHERASQQPAGGGLPVSGGMKMIVYHPVSYEDTQNIIDNIKNRKPVIVNMEELEIDCAQRILDFLSGAVYALNGTMSRFPGASLSLRPIIMTWWATAKMSTTCNGQVRNSA